jgi:acetylornithine deacetylase/succinyl-diaminopimelate desuccinylase-like protein
VEVESLLAELVRIKSVNPPGGETEVATCLKHLFDSCHIPNEIIESNPGRGNFLAYLGEGEKSLLYLAHIDVVPVTEGWSFPPFSGEIKGGFVHGRGTLDCKGLAAAQAVAMIRLSQSGKLGGRLIFAATAGEETGGIAGVKYLAENYAEKIRADFVVTEGGWQPMKIGNKVCHFVQAGEKGVIRAKIRTSGVSAHGALPTLGDNAVVKMARTINGLADYQPPITLIPEVSELVQKIAGLSGFSDKISTGNISRFIGSVDDRMLSAYLTSITRMTVSSNVVRGGVKANIIPDYSEAEVDIRVLPGQDPEFVLKELGRVAGKAEMEITRYTAPTFSRVDSKLYELVSNTMTECLPEDTILPCVATGSTDCRYLRPMGIPCYGIGMMALDLDEKMKQSVHGRDEKIDIGSLKLKTYFLTRLAGRYLGV